jgi:hypothetical protein
MTIIYLILCMNLKVLTWESASKNNVYEEPQSNKRYITCILSYNIMFSYNSESHTKYAVTLIKLL